MPDEDLTPEEMEALALEMEDRALDGRIVAELESVPDLSDAIPDDFAAGVVARVPSRRPVSVPVRESRYGWAAMWCCLVVLLGAMVVLSAQGFGRSTVGTAVEWTLCAQFLAIAIWFAMRGWRAS
jgi:hypothetical protein